MQFCDNDGNPVAFGSVEFDFVGQDKYVILLSEEGRGVSPVQKGVATITVRNSEGVVLAQMYNVEFTPPNVDALRKPL